MGQSIQPVNNETKKHSISLLECLTDFFETFLEYSCGFDVCSFSQMVAEGYDSAEEERNTVSE